VKYFYDLEFEDNGQYIIPISLGMVSADDRELYLINAEYIQSWIDLEPYYWKNAHASEPNKWLATNVINPIIDGSDYYAFTRLFWWLPIVLEFISDSGKYMNREQIELWGYYGAYDHVCLAQLFGPMIKLPEPIPMFTHEIMQLKRGQSLPMRDLAKFPEHNALADAKYQKLIYESWV